MLASVWSLEIEGILTFLAFAFGWIGLTSVFVAINIPLGKALNQSQTKYCRIGLVLGSLSVLKCYQLMGFEPKLLIFVLLPLLAALSLFYLTFRKYG
ncbi:hypothetical protein RI845_02810 [Thalassotalea nanhaiensis]|uniref:Uncharacterized protein n=1 Tax=Thalassotalea nanhaiensis TaxID=3065648 RepID=A0ABY9TN05_9GAMM|nr:hypothetical protein RI845_02810 [Colwelliaceae bacterium SQ345]